MDAKVTTFIRDLGQSDPPKAEIVSAVRAIYRETEPALEERFIYGGIGMFLGGELIGGIFAYANHVTIEFSLGEGLADPQRLLEGKGKSRRHLKLRQAADVAGKTVGSFIRQTLERD